MSIKSEQTKLIIKRKLLNTWYGFWNIIGKLLSKPYNYIHNENVKRWSNPNNYNKIRLRKIIIKEIAHALMYSDIYLIDSNDIFHDEDSGFDLPYEFMEHNNSKYMNRYRRYAYKHDKCINWCEFIIENLDNVEVECVKGKDVISRWSHDYNRYENTDVYIIKLKED